MQLKDLESLQIFQEALNSIQMEASEQLTGNLRVLLEMQSLGQRSHQTMLSF